MSISRLLKEIAILIRCEIEWGIPAVPTIRQLVTDFCKPNGPEPVAVPIQPVVWPANGIIDCHDYWKAIDAKH